MELRHLRLVETVARTGTLTKAADLLHLSQSALSHQLKELEGELGTPLFYRMNKRLTLSSAGHIMLETAQKVLADLETAKKEIQKENGGEIGTIRLSTHCYTCYHWLPNVLSAFSQHHNQLQIEIHPSFTRNPLPALLEDKVDLVITNVPDNHREIAYKDLFWDEQLVVIPAEHPWAMKEFLTPHDLVQENLIIYSGPFEDFAIYKKLMAPNNIHPQKITEMMLTEASIEMIKNGLGVKVMASWAVRPYLKDQSLKVVPLTRNGFFRTWYLAYRKAEGWKKQYDIFKAHLVESTKKM